MKPTIRRYVRLFWLPAIFLIALAGFAQRRQYPDNPLPNPPYRGQFTFLRVKYEPLRGSADRKWNHDYPRAEVHFSKILKELTLVDTYLAGGSVVTAEDPELFMYPIAYVTEPGYFTLSDSGAIALRSYLKKGGFIIFDDFLRNEWYNFESQLYKILPGARLVRLDGTHPIFDSFFRIRSLDVFAHPFEGLPSEFWAVFENNDPTKRIMVIANYNNDMTEYWEWSDEDFAPIEITNEAYKLGINYVIYAMTH